jgi:hypothetical protein
LANSAFWIRHHILSRNVSAGNSPAVIGTMLSLASPDISWALSMVNLALHPAISSSWTNSASQSRNAPGGSTVSASMQMNKSVSVLVNAQAWLRAPDFLWVLSTVSWTRKGRSLLTRFEFAICAVASVQLSAATTIRSANRSWASTESNVAPMLCSSL